MFKKFIKPAALAACAALFLPACHHRGGSVEKRVDAATERIARKLDLSEPQKKLLNELKQEIILVQKELKEQKKKNLTSLRAQVTTQLDRETLLGFYTERKAVLDAHAESVVDKVVALHASLNEEQKKEILEFLDKVAEWHRE